MVQKKNARRRTPAAKRKTVYGNGKKSRQGDGWGWMRLRVLMELRIMELEVLSGRVGKKNLYFLVGESNGPTFAVHIAK